MKISIGDVVEVRYANDHTYAEWNGFRFRVIKILDKYGVEGEVIKTVSTMVRYSVGDWISWGAPEALVVISLDPDNPRENQVYIDHIYERLTQNVTPEELLILAARLESFAKTK